MEEKLVSIIIPCYNCSSFVGKLLDSLLIQDYKSIEIFAIDDGSTDGTLKRLTEFEQDFTQKGYAYHVLHQENQGQSFTINKGLKLISGTYLLWPDADDWFEDSTTISKMVSALQNHPDYNCVRVLPYYVDGKSQNKSPIRPTEIKENLFYDFLYWNNNIWAPAGSHMIKTEVLFENIKARNIFTSRNVGQNYQLILPVLYKGKCFTIQQHLYNILIRKGSHSRGTYSTCEQEIGRWEECSTMLISVISDIPQMDNLEKDNIINFIIKRYNKFNYKTAIRHRHFLTAFKYFIKFILGKQ